MYTKIRSLVKSKYFQLAGFVIILLILPVLLWLVHRVQTYQQHASSLPDIDVLYIERTPRYNFDAGKNNPSPGDTVTFTAHIKNSGTLATGPFQYIWTLDNTELTSNTISNLTPGQGTTATVQWQWQNGTHTITFQADKANIVTEITKQNNTISDRTNAIAVGFWVEQGLYNWFNQNQGRLGIGSESWEDWAQRDIKTMNSLFAESTYPEFPQGVLDRVRLDKVVVVPDHALPLHGGLPTNDPDSSDKTVDIEWGFPTYDSSGKAQWDNGFYGTNGQPNLDTTDTKSFLTNHFLVEYALLHEMGHARYLVDLYAWNVNPHPNMNDVLVTKRDGTQYLPAGVMKYFQCEGGMMECQAPSDRQVLYSKEDVYALNLIAGKRATCGNENAPCNLGAFLLNIPASNYVKVIDANNQPVANAHVFVYQSVPGDTTQDFYAKRIDNTADITCTTDTSGMCSITAQPFTHMNVGSDGMQRGVDLIKVQTSTQEVFQWLYLSDANLAYFHNASTATYTVSLASTSNPTPTLTPTRAISSPTPSPTRSPSPTRPSTTNTPTPSPTRVPSATYTPSPIPTSTPSPIPTSAPKATPTPTLFPTFTPTPVLIAQNNTSSNNTTQSTQNTQTQQTSRQSTGTNTSQPILTPTPTPIPAKLASLPATGPENLLTKIGLTAFGFIVVGAIFMIGL